MTAISAESRGCAGDGGATSCGSRTDTLSIVPARLADIADLLDRCPREGAAEDVPEGTRCVTLSDTLAKKLAAELRRHVPATLEAREAPDLAKELIAWLDNNVMRCDHGCIGTTCHICMRDHLPR